MHELNKSSNLRSNEPIKNPPASLYKYIPPERAESVLGKLLIRFSQASVMNDTEEFKPPINGISTSEAFQKAFAERADILFPGLMALVEKQGPDYINKLHKQAEGGLQRTTETIHEMNDKNFGILSLSEDPASPSMWIRYADQGRGFVLEFDSSHSWFWQKTAENDDLRHLRRVSYVDRRPKNLFETSAEDYLYSKEKKWALEKEWRLMLNFNSAACKAGKDNKGTDVLLFAIPPDCLLSVAVGYAANPEFIGQIRTAIAANPSLSHVRLRAARQGEGGQIEIRDIDAV
jgi:hypothetical protein